MDNYDQRTQHVLSDAWRRGGRARVRQIFMAAARDKQTAADYINDQQLGFPVFFILLEDIGQLGLLDQLSPRNIAAFYICTQKITRLREWLTEASQLLSPTGRGVDETMYGAARWMLDTGVDWDGLGPGHDEYDAVIDYVTALLIMEYHDSQVLPEIVKLIFRRNRRGVNIHDLVWSFFQTLDSDALSLVAGYLNAREPADRKLAATLLGIELPARSGGRDLQTMQRAWGAWLEDNKPYIHLTGEHLQMTSQPHHFDIDWEAKYLGKDIAVPDGAAQVLMTEDAACLRGFRDAPPETQRLLADYSHRLRQRDKGSWQVWLQREIADQAAMARQAGEGEAI